MLSTATASSVSIYRKQFTFEFHFIFSFLSVIHKNFKLLVFDYIIREKPNLWYVFYSFWFNHVLSVAHYQREIIYDASRYIEPLIIILHLRL